MGLTIIRREEPKPQQAKGKFDYAEWYKKNAKRLSEKRAKRYKEDPEYRAAALKRGRTQHKKKPTPVTDGYTVSIKQAADAVGVSVWVLREWRRKNWFPEPRLRDRRLWFTPAQVTLLKTLEAFFTDHDGHRVTPAMQAELDALVSLVYANW